MKLPIVPIACVVLSAAVAFVTVQYTAPSREAAAPPMPAAPAQKMIEGKSLGVLKSPVGDFFMAIRGREKTDKGYRFAFSLGNISAASYEGLKLQVRWGRKPEKKDEKVKLSAQDFAITHLPAGQWKDFEMVIPATDEKDIEIVQLFVVSTEKAALAEESK